MPPMPTPTPHCEDIGILGSDRGADMAAVMGSELRRGVSVWCDWVCIGLVESIWWSSPITQSEVLGSADVGVTLGLESST